MLAVEMLKGGNKKVQVCERCAGGAVMTRRQVSVCTVPLTVPLASLPQCAAVCRSVPQGTGGRLDERGCFVAESG